MNEFLNKARDELRELRLATTRLQGIIESGIRDADLIENILESLTKRVEGAYREYAHDGPGSTQPDTTPAAPTDESILERSAIRTERGRGAMRTYQPHELLPKARLEERPVDPELWGTDFFQGDEEPLFEVFWEDTRGEDAGRIGSKCCQSEVEANALARGLAREGAKGIKRIQLRGCWMPSFNPNPPNPSHVPASHDLVGSYHAAGLADSLPNEEEILDLREIEEGLRGHFQNIVEKLFHVRRLESLEEQTEIGAKVAVKLLKSVIDDDRLPDGHAAKELAKRSLARFE